MWVMGKSLMMKLPEDIEVFESLFYAWEIRYWFLRPQKWTYTGWNIQGDWFQFKWGKNFF